MDKFEYKVKADEIKELIAQREYAMAAEIADEIDWRRVKSVMMLCTISDLYKINRRYEDAINLLLLAYERRPGGRTICYSLCELYIKAGDFVRAVKYYNEFRQVAPEDSNCYILHYKLLEAQNASLEERIEVLEAFKSIDHREKWAYELAYLYHRMGLATRCVEECDDLILWFGEGKYVVKAMELKMLHQPLTPDQQYKYDHRFDTSENDEDVQEQSSQGDEALAQEKAVPSKEQPGVAEQYIAQQQTIPAREMPAGVKAVVEPTPEPVVQQPEEEEIQVKTVDVGQCNTINLQAELAAGLQEFWRSQQITQTIMEPMMESDTESLDYPQVEEVDENDLAPEEEVIESTEVFFGETGEITQVQPESLAKGDTSDLTELKMADAAEQPAEAQDTARKVMEQMRLESMGIREEEVLAAQPPKELEHVLAQQSDGQLRIVVPEREMVEKQITGQMNFQDIFEEWERSKKEKEEKRKKELRDKIGSFTGKMLDEFEVNLRDSVLEQLDGMDVGPQDIDRMVKDAMDKAEAEKEQKPESTETVEDIVAESTEPAEESDKAESAESVEESDKAESTESTEESDKTESTESTEESDKTESTEFAEESDKTESTEPTEESDKAENTEPAEESGKAESTEESDKAESTETAEESDKAENAEPVQATENAEARSEKPKVRSLTREERELYAPFIQSRSARETLVKAIDGISLAAYTGNLIITGEEGMNPLVLAKRIVREIQMTDSNFSGKVAMISGDTLNQKDVEEIVKGLDNGALVIKKASGMTAETSERLHRALQQENFGIVVILVDTKKSITKLLLNKPKLLECFTARVDLEPMSNATLVSFGKQYARELEYFIDEVGGLALHSRIEELQTSDHVVTVMDVKEIVDEAIRRANRKTMRHFVDVLVGKRYNDEDMIVLTERHFD